MKLKLVLLLSTLVSSVGLVYAGGCYPSYNRGYYRQSYGYNYYQPYYQPVKVVNQLVGIPVAVPYVAPIAEQGKTNYAVSLQSYQFSKPFDFSLAFTQGNRLIEQAQALQQQGMEGMQQSLQLAIEGSTRVAEINAKRDAAVATLKAAESQGEALRLRLSAEATTGHPRTHTEPLEPAPIPREEIPPNGNGSIPPPNGGNGGNGGNLGLVLRAKCFACHKGTQVDQDGQLVETANHINLAKFAVLPPELKDIVMKRIHSDKDDERMPPPPAEKLTWKEALAFGQNY